MAHEGIDRAAVRVRFYSDHASDAPVMEWADEPFAANPSAKMRALAEKRGLAGGGVGPELGRQGICGRVAIQSYGEAASCDIDALSMYDSAEEFAVKTHPDRGGAVGYSKRRPRRSRARQSSGTRTGAAPTAADRQERCDPATVKPKGQIIMRPEPGRARGQRRRPRALLERHRLLDSPDSQEGVYYCVGRATRRAGRRNVLRR